MSRRLVLLSRPIAAGLAAIALLAVAPPASAQLTVFDPSNYSQNVLTAARALDQINNQITALENQAQMLINQARNLASLPQSILAPLQAEVARTQQLIGEAQHLAYDVGQVDQAFSSRYGAVSLSTTDADLVARAQQRWQASVAGFQDALRVQAGVVGNMPGAKDQMQSLVTSSQGATGALQAAQAGNQLLALQAQQLSDIAALLASQGRAQALSGADLASALADAQARLSQFFGGAETYQPGSVELFH
ncbi:P-type conjugative transfer protein TrbJ [Caulobacter sp. KR2-114]|uniref:P-type conjugative transfer protein TrbJ n=1 Tax=Caulobacter sp. KR2-114 TaxID=3400912 RepID=UPI003BFDF749